MATTCPSCGAKNLEGADECANCGADLRTVDLPKPVSKLEQAVMLLPLTSLQLSHVPSGSGVGPFSQLRPIASTFAVLVFPVPLGPEKR